MTAPLADIGHQGPYVTARLSGDIDIANVDQVRSRILDAVSPDALGLIVDLSSVRYVDSAGMHMLFELVRRLQTRRQGMAITVPDGSPIRTLLKMTNVNAAAPVCGTLDECQTALHAELDLY